MICDHCRVHLDLWGGGGGAMPCKLGIEKLRLRVNMQKEMSVADTNLDLLRKSRKDRSYR